MVKHDGRGRKTDKRHFYKNILTGMNEDKERRIKEDAAKMEAIRQQFRKENGLDG